MRWIYALVDPRQIGYASVFYVGQTRACAARFKTHKCNRKPTVYAKIKELLDEGLAPVFVQLEETSADHVDAAENKWILYFKGLGTPIVNVSLGKGSYGLKASAEHRAKISKALTGKSRSEAHCKALSEGHKGLKPTEEARRNMSAGQKRRKPIPMPAHVKEILRKANEGRRPTEEQKRRVSETSRKNWHESRGKQPSDRWLKSHAADLILAGTIDEEIKAALEKKQDYAWRFCPDTTGGVK